MALTRRHFRGDVDLSIIGFGGMVSVGMAQGEVNTIVAESYDRGVNYFDVAPFYGNGEAERKLGTALGPYRSRIFLASKTLQRDKTGSRKELERSLSRLRTDCFDLYQFHAVTTLNDVETIFGPHGAAESLAKAREQGKVRFLGFSAHSVEAALAMLECFEFDSMLFPVNFVSYARNNFGPRVMERAKELGVARVALKALAQGPWRKGEERRFPKCWYKPIEDPVLARQALRFTLSEDVTAAIPPGDERIFRTALALAGDFIPLTPGERAELFQVAERLQALFKK